MRERPILFSAPMVRAILDGRKTQTRRVIKGAMNAPHLGRLLGEWPLSSVPCGPCDGALRYEVQTDVDDSQRVEIRCPYGAPGDRLWVRETWQAIHVYTDPETGHGDDVTAAATIPKSNENGWWGVAYAATDPQANEHRDDRGFSWRPGIHMPRWASRINLAVDSVRVERLRDITDADARAEGIGDAYRTPGMEHAAIWTERDGFARLWSQINGAESWDANPWVWVIGFRRVTP